MAFRPNYGQERAQKNRAKEERKQEKLKKREEASLQRKALREAEATGSGGPGSEEKPGE